MLASSKYEKHVFSLIVPSSPQVASDLYLCSVRLLHPSEVHTLSKRKKCSSPIIFQERKIKSWVVQEVKLLTHFSKTQYGQCLWPAVLLYQELLSTISSRGSYEFLLVLSFWWGMAVSEPQYFQAKVYLSLFCLPFMLKTLKLREKIKRLFFVIVPSCLPFSLL